MKAGICNQSTTGSVLFTACRIMLLSLNIYNSLLFKHSLSTSQTNRPGSIFSFLGEFESIRHTIWEVKICEVIKTTDYTISTALFKFSVIYCHLILHRALTNYLITNSNLTIPLIFTFYQRSPELYPVLMFRSWLIYLLGTHHFWSFFILYFSSVHFIDLNVVQLGYIGA